jgi:hypothetical protein
MEITLALSSLDQIKTKDLLNLTLNFGAKDRQFTISGH